ncbi:MAG: hypothetical protein PHD63_06170 [Candidatus Marinimicrobia bacterium]|jgi:hypothetical protein|nr:hypothetical protein [Candidatus Neomarinimicrobiota bacterium]MDD4092888.1 hypothetical protein [Smithellaceae bacterium]
MKRFYLWCVTRALRSLTEEERVAVIAEVYPDKHLRKNPRKKK